jgi:hypothetical protein
MNHGRAFKWALAAVVMLGFAGAVRAAEIPFDFKGARRIVAVGDVHGSYVGLVENLQMAGLIDKKQRWIGGETHLVQMGDLVDRGPDSRKIIDFFMKLEKNAEKKGGKVHVLIGNHDAMQIIGLLDHTSPEEIAAFKDRNSKKVRDQVFERRYQRLLEEAKAGGLEEPDKKAERETFESEIPLGYIEHRRAFHPEGEYGSWILTHNVAIRLNGIIFSHADWSEEMALLGLEAVNHQIRQELSGEADLQTGIAFEADSPLQNRRFSRVPLVRAAQEAAQPELDRVLAALGASRIVVGHTMTRGVIEPRFGGKHISTDTGMLGFYGGGQRVVLEVEGDRLRAIHPGGKIDLPDYLDETNLAEYLAAVMVVDPTNIVAQVELAEQYNLAKQSEAAERAIGKIFEIPKPIPERYTEKVCILYDNIAAKGSPPNAWVEEHCRN